MVSLIKARKLSSYIALILTRLLEMNITETCTGDEMLHRSTLSCSKGLADEDQLHQKGPQCAHLASSKNSPQIG